MGRSRYLVILVGTLLAGLCLPAASLAGTYSWDLPANFTSSPPGANPDHDAYGAQPWSYVDASAPSGLALLSPTRIPGAFRALDTFGTLDGGLTGWKDSSDPNALVALNNTSSPAGEVPAGALAMTPAADRVAAIGWTSPLTGDRTVSISGTFAPLGSCPGTVPNWTLEQNGSEIASGSGTGPITASPTVSQGGIVYLTVDYTNGPLGYDAQCDTAAVTLHITASESIGPHVTLDSPANGALISGGQPSFSGSASTAFGAAPTVTVRLYQGASATGSPMQTLTTTRAGSGAYSVGSDAQLADGQYTAQAEQDDLASPADIGLSAPSTFIVHNAAPVITLKSLGTKPLKRTNPTLTGVAGIATGDERSVFIGIYPGNSTNAPPLRYLTASVGSNGRYSVKVTPALSDGQYTAVAAQNGPQGVGLSPAMTFRIKVHAPVVTVSSPAKGSSIGRADLSFSGAAGTALGDSSSISVLVYAGSRAHGKALFTLRTKAHGATWTAAPKSELKLGLYTAVAKQRDDAGHTGVSRSHTFLLVSGPTAIGAAVKLSASGAVSVSISCLAPSAQTCTGSVLILTQRSLQPLRGGPAGAVRVLFAYVSIPGGKTELVSRPMRSDVARALHRLKSVRLRVTANLTGSPHSSALRTLEFSR